MLIGDSTQPQWDDAPDWQRTSAINGVKFHIQHPDAKPSCAHESWLAEKVATGWVYGSVKDANKKQHPCCVPYDQLPVEQKVKDALFIGVVNAIRAIISQ